MFSTKPHSARTKTSHVRKAKPRVEDHAGIQTSDGATCTLTYGQNSVYIIHFLDSAQKIYFSAQNIYTKILVFK